MALGSLIPIVLVAALGVITIKNIKGLIRDNEWVDHSNSVINQAKALEASAVDMETGMRGYLLAGEENFLEPYNNGEETFSHLASTLAKTVADNPAQVTRIGEIQNTIDAWQTKVTEPNIKLRREIGNAKTMDDIADLVGEKKGKSYFDKFRRQIETFVERESELMQERQATSESQFSLVRTGIENLQQTNDWVDHTYEVIQQIRLAEGAALNIETGMRGFLLAGKETFLEPYNKGRDEFSSIIADLSERVSDNPDQVELLQEISANIEAWQIKVTEPAIRLRREVGKTSTLSSIVDLVAEGKGKQYFDKFREQVQLFVHRETTLMKERQETGKQMAANSTRELSKLKKNNDWVEHTHRVIESARLIESTAGDMETGMRGYLLAGVPDFLEPYKTGEANFTLKVAELSETVADNPAQVSLLSEITLNIEAWKREVTEPFITLRTDIGDAKTMNDMAELIAQSKGKVFFDEFRDQIAEFVTIENELMKQRRSTSTAAAAQTVFIVIAGTVLTMILATLFSTLISRGIASSLKSIFKGLKRFTTNELTWTGDQLKLAAQRIVSSSNYLTSSSAQLAEGSNEQAASLEETSASLIEISGMVEQNSGNARKASTLSKEALDSTQRGQSAMEGMKVAINAIQNTSNETAKIINSINDIAFQTNILALNAAVEAARAGEAGAGFAVVADEVRNLAQRCARSAEETNIQIEASIQNATKGVQASSDVEGLLAEIHVKVNEVTSLVQDVSSASQEQANGIRQVNTTMQQLDQLTQSNSAESETLAGQAEQMKGVISSLDAIVGGSEETLSSQAPIATPPRFVSSVRTNTIARGQPTISR